MLIGQNLFAPSRLCVKLSAMQRLGKNHGGYKGETIDIAVILRDDIEAARSFGWQIDELPASEGLDLVAFRRQADKARNPELGTRNIYISTGIHGDEPAGPLAVRQLLHENPWPADLDLWVCPCLNPTGFPLNRRENAHGNDLNRDYRHFETTEIRAHVAWLKRQPSFDVTLCLHEDWESHGFYLYELNPDHRPSLAPAIIRQVSSICPIDMSPVIEEREARGGIINPDLDPNSRPQWPEAFYLIQKKTRLSYTLEAPSDFPLATRVAALVTAVLTVLDGLK